MSSRGFLLALLGLSLSLPGRTPAQQAGGSIRLLEPADSLCESRVVLQRFRQLGKAFCLVGETTHTAGVARVTVNGTEAVTQEGAGGATRFVGYVKLDPALREVKVSVEPRSGTAVAYRFALSGVAEVTSADTSPRAST